MLVVVNRIEREHTADGVWSPEEVGSIIRPRIAGPREDAFAVRKALLEWFNDLRFVGSRLLKVLGTGVCFPRGASAAGTCTSRRLGFRRAP